mmetsp:Transcript_57614/g.166801  ORF Transcript_57614/g.166801 Transcript_57614/m.166801 type:complete len:347 (-) Transcript_57614:9-1049(-)
MGATSIAPMPRLRVRAQDVPRGATRQPGATHAQIEIATLRATPTRPHRPPPLHGASVAPMVGLQIGDQGMSLLATRRPARTLPASLSGRCHPLQVAVLRGDLWFVPRARAGKNMRCADRLRLGHVLYLEGLRRFGTRSLRRRIRKRMVEFPRVAVAFTAVAGDTGTIVATFAVGVEGGGGAGVHGVVGARGHVAGGRADMAVALGLAQTCGARGAVGAFCGESQLDDETPGAASIAAPRILSAVTHGINGFAGCDSGDAGCGDRELRHARRRRSKQGNMRGVWSVRVDVNDLRAPLLRAAAGRRLLQQAPVQGAVHARSKAGQPRKICTCATVPRRCPEPAWAQMA